MIRQIRMVVPVTFVIMTLLFFAGFELALQLIERNGAVPIPVLRRPSIMFLLAAAAAYGIYRGIAPHPAFRADYHKWLATTPWQRGKPLPMGPIDLVWQDGVILFLAGALAYGVVGLDPMVLLQVFLFCYLLMLALALAVTGPWPFGPLVAFGLGLAFLHVADSPLCVVVEIGVYFIAYLGLWRSLGMFPWDGPESNYVGRLDAVEAHRREQLDEAWLGWPYFRMAPVPIPSRSLRIGRAFLGCLLAGWWLYVVQAVCAQQGFAFPFPPMLAVLLPSIYVSIYCKGYESPLSFWGRLVHFKWIIPGYDKVFLPPLGVLVLGPAATLLLYKGGLDFSTSMSLAATLCLLVLFVASPDLIKWRLTGKHRIVPAIANKKDFVQVS